jgi:glucokinase
VTEGVGITVGVDLGGSNLRVAALRGGTAEELVARREPVGEPRDPETVIGRVAALVEEVRAAAGAAEGDLVPVGVGIAAMLRDRAGTVANSPHLRWRDVAFGRMLAARLGPARPLGVYNDVNAITWGEFVLGAGRDADDVLAVFLGTGIGAGLVAGGRLVEGASACAGEIGHVKVAWGDDAPPCACGGRGCVEAFAGGSSIQARARRELAAGARSSAAVHAGGPEHVNPGHIEQAAAEGDEWALARWAELGTLLGVVLAGAIQIVNPARLILGGGVLSRAPLLREHVIAAMTVAATPPLLERLVVRDAALGDDAGLVGAALLAAAGVSIIAP